MRAAAGQVSGDDAVRAVVIYGGDKVFAAGADVKEFAAASHTDMIRDAEPLSSSIDAIARIAKPVVAAVTGDALGGGCELAFAADFRVSAENARWGQPEILLGIMPSAVGTQGLPAPRRPPSTAVWEPSIPTTTDFGRHRWTVVFHASAWLRLSNASPSWRIRPVESGAASSPLRARRGPVEYCGRPWFSS